MKRLVLAGAGHAHAQVLLEFAQRGVKNIEIVLVSPVAQAPYSGMIPGWLAGHYAWQECCLDFVQLCQHAGAHLRLDCVTGIDPDNVQVILESGERISYDWLSLNIGSTLTPPANGHAMVLPMRPLLALHTRWDEMLQLVRKRSEGTSYRVVMVGGGAAGVESILAAHQRLTLLAPHVRLQFTLATHGDDIVPGLADGAAKRLHAHLTSRGIRFLNHFSASSIEDAAVVGDDGRKLQADAVLWATGAQAYRWPEQSGLGCDKRGFVRIDATLRSLSHPNVFAAGDCASLTPSLPKAGVFAVRMGPILASNLYAATQGRALQTYRPQRHYLVLIGTGGEHAVAAWGPLAWQGDWVWKWKQRIDRRFIARYDTQKIHAASPSIDLKKR
jgi:pyridine nucleotide-disulfide oxidoreductase family protein